ncbi:MerR family transcriptional regulator [Asanoa sp. NPDC050611]|uniref:MerR family transcriptional regulator n=1 Tax=Asanoa sp. NPDC050611 TaxID=3157098 RepID=UPI003408C9D1
MAWSTRELAELAGTTVNTIRHCHRLGLIEEPDRRYNGYKKYGVRDLVCLLRIRRLAELGVPLARIAEVGAGGDGTPDALRQVDAHLAAILRDSAPADVPQGFESVASRLSEADSSILHIYTRLYDEDALADLRRMVEADPDDISVAIDTLPPDADEPTRARLAEQLAPTLAKHLADYPWLSDPAARSSQSEQVTQQTFIAAVTELYNKAQLDVLHRASLLAQEQLEGPTGDG